MPQRTRYTGPMCRAKLKSPGTHGDGTCHRAPMANGRCYFHGGATPAGIASAHFKTGKYSKYCALLPADWARHFHPDHPRIVELVEELALTDSSIAAALVHLQAGEATAPHWQDACAAKDTFKRARDAKDLTAMAAQFDRLDALLTGGASRERTADKLFDRVALRAKLVAVESKRRKDAHEMVDRADFGRFAKAVLRAVATHVRDPATRGTIQDDVLRLLAMSRGALIDGDAA
jgi:hypothetical protein